MGEHAGFVCGQSFGGAEQNTERKQHADNVLNNGFHKAPLFSKCFLSVYHRMFGKREAARRLCLKVPEYGILTAKQKNKGEFYERKIFI